ncbi:MAG: hypothetical protein N2446_01120 [Elusimicrobiales bacterium]|nr:hypothetical protein [Elusimicrobiales bacterium]
MITKELILKREKKISKYEFENKGFEKWKNITQATKKLLTYLLITKN